MNPSSDPVPVSTIPSLPARPREAHKGTFGKVLVVAGSTGMSGAAVLAGTAALRAGAGLAQLAVPAPIGPIVAIGQPCCTTVWLPADPQGRLTVDALSTLLPLAQQANALVVGPGLGQSPDIQALLLELIRTVSSPLVLDADALNVLAPRLDILRTRPHPFLLTPHPGEFARLLGTDSKTVQQNRSHLAVSFTRQHGGVLVLKGADTLVTDGARLFTNSTGNPGMATGGSGDVLSGLLGALLAQKLDPFEAAVLGVYLHGLAGDLARDQLGEASLIATDLLDHLPSAFCQVSASR